MSVFGIIVIILFLLSMGGSIMLYYADSRKVNLARFLMFVLYMLIFAELILALFEFPAYVVDGVIFISMGMENIANIVLGILGIAVAFFFFIIIPKIHWRRFLRTTPVKLVICGILIIGGLIYTELYNGMYSFENPDDFYSVREMYSQYDNGFWPVKLIETDETETDGTTKQISVYPFDATTANGKQPLAYRVTIYRRFENGDYSLYYYPFTYKTYIDGDSYAFDEVWEVEVDLSGSDLSGSDLSGSNLSDSDSLF